MITWRVWSPMPPECMERISSTSMLDAARAWADRQFRKGLLVRSGTDVLVCSESDASPRHSTYRVRITIADAPAFRASFAGLAFEGLNGDPSKGGQYG